MVNNVVILGITKSTGLIFNEEFPELKKIEIEPYNITYNNSGNLVLKLIADASRISNVIKKEHEHLKQIVMDHKVDVVISDNRFGLYHNTCETVYITHQLTVKAGIWSYWANKIHHYYIKKFTKIWIPDFENVKESLAGDLSRSNTLEHCFYLGPLSRLNPSVIKTEAIDYLLLLSGVEPQRSLLEAMICERFINSKKKMVLVRGTTIPFKMPLPANVEVIDLPNAMQLEQYVKNASTVVCRSGYSTLMDLYVLNKKNIILIPTPGQFEQEYLARYWEKKHHVKVVLQDELYGWSPS